MHRGVLNTVTVEPSLGHSAFIFSQKPDTCQGKSTDLPRDGQFAFVRLVGHFLRIIDGAKVLAEPCIVSCASIRSRMSRYEVVRQDVKVDFD